eukprot:663188-Rhodomonas_salina.2
MRERSRDPDSKSKFGSVGKTRHSLKIYLSSVRFKTPTLQLFCSSSKKVLKSSGPISTNLSEIDKSISPCAPSPSSSCCHRCVRVKFLDQSGHEGAEGVRDV